MHEQMEVLTTQLHAVIDENSRYKEQELHNQAEQQRIQQQFMNQIQGLIQQLSESNEVNALQAERIADLTRRLFGRKSEKTKHMRDVEMAAESGLFVKPDMPANEPGEFKERRRKERGHKEKSIAHLPEEEVIVQLPASERTCIKCGNEMKHLANKYVRSEIEYVPARLVKKKIYKEVCHCDCHDPEFEAKPIVSAVLVQQPLPKTVATPSLLAQIIHQKFSLYVPIYRQNDDWKRLGLPTTIRTMYSWINHSATEVLLMVYDRLLYYLKLEDAIHSDETTFKINKDEKGTQMKSKSYIWQLRTGVHSSKPVIYYHANKSRGQGTAQSLLESFEGFCHVDMHYAYKKVPGITLVGCIGHLRRYFFEAVEVVGKGAAATGLAYINEIFNLDRGFKDKEPEQILKLRQEYSKPIFEDFYRWVESLGNVGNGKFKKAVGYALNNKEFFMNVYLDGRLQLSNNAAETFMKPIALGRKNYLFADTQIGAKANVIHHTIVETAEVNGLDPYKYLEYLLGEIPNSEYMREEVIDTFLPWTAAVQEKCRKIEMSTS
jgi:transposase